MSKWELPKDPQFYKWESPITEIFKQAEENYLKQMNDELEEQLMCEVKYQVGYSVDKDELIKALNYDREQYDKGYIAGARETFNAELEEIKAEILKVYPIASNPKDKEIGYGIHIALEILEKHIKKNCCDTCTHKGYDCDNDFWIDCEQYDGEINNEYKDQNTD